MSLTMDNLKQVFPNVDSSVLTVLLHKLNTANLDINLTQAPTREDVLFLCQQWVAKIINSRLPPDFCFSYSQEDRRYALKIKPEDETRALPLRSLLDPFSSAGIVTNQGLYSDCAVRDATRPLLHYVITASIPTLFAFIVRHPSLTKDWTKLFKQGSAPYKQLATWTTRINAVQKNLTEIIDVCVSKTGEKSDQRKNAFQELLVILEDCARNMQFQLALETSQAPTEVAFFLELSQEEIKVILNAHLQRLFPQTEITPPFGQVVPGAAALAFPPLAEAGITPISAQACSAPHAPAGPAIPAQIAALAPPRESPAAAPLPSLTLFQPAPRQPAAGIQRKPTPPTLPDMPTRPAGSPYETELSDCQARVTTVLKKFHEHYSALNSVKDFLTLFDEYWQLQKYLYDKQIKIIQLNQNTWSDEIQRSVLFINSLKRKMNSFLQAYFEALCDHPPREQEKEIVSTPPKALCPKILNAILAGTVSNLPPLCTNFSDPHRDEHTHVCPEGGGCRPFHKKDTKHRMRYPHDDLTLIEAICVALAERNALISLEKNYLTGYSSDHSLLFQVLKNPDGTLKSSDKIENLCRRLSEKKDLQTALRLAYYVEWVTCEWLAHLDGKDLRREPVQQLCQTVKQCVLDFYGLPHTERTKKFHSGLCTPLLSLQQRYLDPLVIPYWQDRDRGFSYLLSGILGTLPAEYSADLSAPYVSAAPQPAAAAAPPYVPQ